MEVFKESNPLEIHQIQPTAHLAPNINASIMDRAEWGLTYAIDTDRPAIFHVIDQKKKKEGLHHRK
jgi:hypothetical protein